MDDGRGLGDVGRRLVRRDHGRRLVPLPLRWRPGRRRRGCRRTPWRVRRRRRDDRGRRRGREGRRGVAVLRVALEEDGVVPQHGPLDAGPQVRLLPRHQIHDVICAGARGMPRLKRRLQHGLDVVGVRDPVRRLHEGGVVRRQSVRLLLPVPRGGRPRRRRGHGQRGRRRRPRRRGAAGGASGARGLRATPRPSLDSWRAGAVSASNWRALADSRADAASARARCASTPPTWKICSCRSAGVKYKPARSAVRVRSPGPRPPLLASAHGSALARRNWLRVRPGERAARRSASTNARCPPGVVSSMRCRRRSRKREMSRGPFGAPGSPSRGRHGASIAARAILADAVFHAHAVVHDDAAARPERDR